MGGGYKRGQRRPGDVKRCGCGGEKDRREQWDRGQFECDVTEYSDGQVHQWLRRASKGFLVQMLCARTPATLLLDLSVAANAAITDAHVALALHELVRQGSGRGAGRAKLKRSFAPLRLRSPAARAAAQSRQFVQWPVSGVLLLAPCRCCGRGR